jgi:hypothetical protein
MKTETVHSSETKVMTKTILRHNSQDRNPHFHSSKNLKFNNSAYYITPPRAYLINIISNVRY